MADSGPDAMNLPAEARAKKKLILKFLRQRTGNALPGIVSLHFTRKILLSKLGGHLVRRAQYDQEIEGRTKRLYRCRGKTEGEFCCRKGNIATVYVDEDKLAQTITFHAHHMRRFFEASPEDVVIDATHNTNDARYKLFSFMIHDVCEHL
ncbi:ATP-binding cassette (ABC) Superfamily [Phytophthora palmivora]|uniref:ATP-binding cassette (ABC) Superfamily n=1 Tax=Phytophthora palmivora TaxID=4796 RepID=A0A2P4YTN8_9STRA|nr:ATP-binding cassette (ABC) Superfamily [Phytophthora palmivora]